MEINLMELWANMGLPVKIVVLLLTAQAVACVAVVIDRLVALTQSSARARQFAALVQPAMEAGQYEQVLVSMADVKSNHLTSYLEHALRTFLSRYNAGDDVQRASELTRRGLERKGDALSRDLNRGMNILASTGSTAPFVGLLGTVLGIIHAFKMIALTGSGGIGAIGGAISEALFVTGYGLIVAIPSVLVFNWLSSKIASYEAGMLNSGSELLDRLEIVAGAALSNKPTAPGAAPGPASGPASGRPRPTAAAAR